MLKLSKMRRASVAHAPHVMDGVLLVDKPSGPTSHDVVARLRSVTGERSVGHTGTLDPLASGLLPLVFGRATRRHTSKVRADIGPW